MHDPFISTIQQFINNHTLIRPCSKIVVGLSGGPDSVALLHALHILSSEYKIDLIAAHLNHEWREEADEDERFCRDLCARLSIPYIAAKASELKIIYSKKNEESGRLLRRAFFKTVAQNHQATAVALAHHADDQQETFFIRLMRGTTLTGLLGIKPHDGLYIRPLLTHTKDEILAYLGRMGQDYRIDHTNNEPTYLRNRLRLEAIPALRKCDTRFDASFFQTLKHLQEAEETLHLITKEKLNKLKTFEPNGCQALNLEGLQTEKEYIRNRILIQWLIEEHAPFTPTKALLDEINRFLMKNEGKDHHLYPSWALRKRQKKIWIIRKTNF